MKEPSAKADVQSLCGEKSSLLIICEDTEEIDFEESAMLDNTSTMIEDTEEERSEQCGSKCECVKNFEDKQKKSVKGGHQSRRREKMQSMGK